MGKIALSLQMGRSSRITVSLPSEVAEVLFTKISKSLIDANNGITDVLNSTPVNIPTTKETLSSDLLRSVNDRLEAELDMHKPVSQKVDKPITEGQPLPQRYTRPATVVRVDKFDTVVEVDKPKPVYDPNRKLTFFRCKKCGITQYRFTSDLDVVECYNCNEETMIHQVEGEYRCPDCNYTAHFKIGNDYVDSLKCKGCGSIVDLKYNTDKGSYMSLNQFR